MTDLPMVSGCALDAPALAAQISRYRQLAQAVTAAEVRGSRLVVELAEETDGALIADTIAVERGCCSFLDVAYDETTRRLSLTAGSAGEPALELITAALAPGLRRGHAGRTER
jgi:hypothetical protein